MKGALLDRVKAVFNEVRLCLLNLLLLSTLRYVSEEMMTNISLHNVFLSCL